MRIALPVAVWALHFGAIYGFTGLACARGWERAVPWTAGGATLVAAAVALFLLLKNLSPDFQRWLAAALAAVALVAILFEGFPVLVLPACALR
jgi:hypothetical protein